MATKIIIMNLTPRQIRRIILNTFPPQCMRYRIVKTRNKCQGKEGKKTFLKGSVLNVYQTNPNWKVGVLQPHVEHSGYRCGIFLAGVTLIKMHRNP